MKHQILKYLGLVVLTIMLFSCGGKKYQKNPLDLIVRDLPSDKPFTAILFDMETKGNFVETFYHQYKIVQDDGQGKLEEFNTGMLQVSKETFNKHINDMGMEVMARDSTGQLSKGAAPPGYSNYVGNEKYGQWKSDNSGNSFWAFYGRYAMMSSMFNMMSYPARRSHYNDYRGGYAGTGRGYYGPSTGGSSYYGTNSAHGRSTKPNSSWSKSRSSFKQNVSSRTARSSTSSSGYRSRSGSFGK
ncbi:MAG: hypothetical protein ACI9A7_002129 [Cyclobacteriaceae bacterium]|jgi:hypothetical protein